MMDVFVYSQILNRKTHYVPWKVMVSALLDTIMLQFTAIYYFVVAAIRNPPELCLSGIRRFGRFCIYDIRQPHHYLGYILINYYQLITFITVYCIIFINFEMLAIAVSVVPCFKFDEREVLGQVQAFR